jgi:hypothetical protein
MSSKKIIKRLPKEDKEDKDEKIEKIEKAEKKTEKKVDKKADKKEETKIKYPISDDTLDELESKVEKFNDMENIGDKIALHSELKETITQLEQEVDDMVEMIDKIDTDVINNKESSSSEQSDITDDVINIEKMIDGMKEEEIMQIKLTHLKKLILMIQKCKSKCGSSNMRISKCN